MDLYSVNAKPFKRTFILYELYGVLAIIVSYFLGRSGLFFVPALSWGRQVALPTLLLMFIASTWFTRKLRKRLEAMRLVEDFELKMQEYEKVYRLRLQWSLLSCLILCVLFVMTERYFFLYFSIFQVLFVLPLYPNTTLFRRELKNDEVILY
jgi:hypothetical protein